METLTHTRSRAATTTTTEARRTNHRMEPPATTLPSRSFRRPCSVASIPSFGNDLSRRSLPKKYYVFLRAHEWISSRVLTKGLPVSLLDPLGHSYLRRSLTYWLLLVSQAMLSSTQARTWSSRLPHTALVRIATGGFLDATKINHTHSAGSVESGARTLGHLLLRLDHHYR
jgi:hypothetical protein